jgi:hypothetical protein
MIRGWVMYNGHGRVGDALLWPCGGPACLEAVSQRL